MLFVNLKNTDLKKHSENFNISKTQNSFKNSLNLKPISLNPFNSIRFNISNSHYFIVVNKDKPFNNNKTFNYV